jgi:hypothetical protein
MAQLFTPEDQADVSGTQLGQLTPETQPIVEATQPNAFQTWDSYRSDPAYGSLPLDQKQGLFDSWREYATKYMVNSGTLQTESDIDYAKQYFEKAAEQDNLKKPRFEAPSYAEEIIGQAQSGLNALQAGSLAYGAASGFVDTDSAARAIVERRLAERNRYINPALQAYGQKQQGFFGSLGDIVSKPFDLAIPMLAQSMGSNAPAIGASLVASAIGTAVGGPGVGAAAGLNTGAVMGGMTDTMVSMDQFLSDEMQKRGLDPYNPADVKQVLDDPNWAGSSKAAAEGRGLAIGASEYATLGFGRFVSTPLKTLEKQGLKGFAKEGLKQTAIQIAGEPVSEIAAQKAEVAGGKSGNIRWNEVAEELAVGLPMSAVEAGGLVIENLNRNNSPATADEVNRQSIQDLRQGELTKLLSQPLSNVVASQFYDVLNLSQKAKVLGLADNAILSEGQGTYDTLSDQEKANVQQAFNTARTQIAPEAQGAPAPTPVPVEQVALGVEPTTVTAPTAEPTVAQAEEEAKKVFEEPTPPVVGVSTPQQISPASAKTLTETAPATATVVAEESKAAKTEVPAPAPVPTPIVEAPAPAVEAPKADTPATAPLEEAPKDKVGVVREVKTPKTSQVSIPLSQSQKSIARLVARAIKGMIQIDLHPDTYGRLANLIVSLNPTLNVSGITKVVTDFLASNNISTSPTSTFTGKSVTEEARKALINQYVQGGYTQQEAEDAAKYYEGDFYDKQNQIESQIFSVIDQQEQQVAPKKPTAAPAPAPVLPISGATPAPATKASSSAEVAKGWLAELDKAKTQKEKLTLRRLFKGKANSLSKLDRDASEIFESELAKREQTAPAPTTAAPATKKLPLTKTQAQALARLGYLPADIAGLDRVQAKEIVAARKRKPRVEKEKAKGVEVTQTPAGQPGATPPQPTPRKASKPVASAKVKPASTNVSPEEGLNKAQADLQKSFDDLAAELLDMTLDEASVQEYFKGTEITPLVRQRLQALMRIITLGLSNARNDLIKKSTAGKGREKLASDFAKKVLNKVVFIKERGGSGVYADPRNLTSLDTLFVDPSKLFKALMSNAAVDPADFFVKMLQEEIIHMTDGRAMYDAFKATNPAEITQEAYEKFYDANNKEIEDSLTIEQIKDVLSSYADSLGISFEGKTKEQIVSEFNVGRPGRLGEEYLRAITQRRESGQITEDQVKKYTTRPILRTLAALRDRFLKLIGKGTKASTRKSFIDDRSDAIVSLLANAPTNEKIAAGNETNVIIPRKDLASALTLQELDELDVDNKLNAEIDQEVMAELAQGMGPDGLIRRLVVGGLARAFKGQVNADVVEQAVLESLASAATGYDATKGAKPSTRVFKFASRKIIDELRKIEAGPEFVSFNDEFATTPFDLKVLSDEYDKLKATAKTSDEVSLETLKKTGEEKVKTRRARGERKGVTPEETAKGLEKEVRKAERVGTKEVPETRLGKTFGDTDLTGESTAQDGTADDIESGNLARQTAIVLDPAEMAQRAEVQKLMEKANLTSFEADALAYSLVPESENEEGELVRRPRYTADTVDSILEQYSEPGKVLYPADFYRAIDSAKQKFAKALAEGGIKREELYAPRRQLASSVSLNNDPASIEMVTKLYDDLVAPKNLKKIVNNIASESLNAQEPLKSLARYIVNNPKWDWVFKSGKTDISPASNIDEYYSINNKKKIGAKERSRLKSETLAFYQAKEDEIFLNKDLLISSYDFGTRSKFVGKPTKQQVIDQEKKKILYFNSALGATVLHELIHKATSRINGIYEFARDRIDLPKSEKEGVPLGELLTRPGKEKATILEELIDGEFKVSEFEYLVSQYNPDQMLKIFGKIEDIRGLYDTVLNAASRQEKQLFAYELSDVDEFMAQAFSNPGFQAFLSKVKVEGNTTAFGKLKQFVKELFIFISGNINEPAKDIAKGFILAEVLQAVSDLVEVQTASPRIVGEPPPNRSILPLASSIDILTTSKALRRGIKGLDPAVAAVLSQRKIVKQTRADTLKRANDFVTRVAPTGDPEDLVRAKSILDSTKGLETNERNAILAVIVTKLRDGSLALDAQIKAKGDSPERSALKDYLVNNAMYIGGQLAEAYSIAGRDLGGANIGADLLYPLKSSKMYTDPIFEKQKEVLESKDEVQQLLAEIEKLKATISGLAAQDSFNVGEKGGISIGQRPPTEAIPEGENFYKLLSVFGDLAPTEGEDFLGYLGRIGISYNDLIASLEGIKASSVSPGGVDRVLPADLKAMSAIDAIRALTKIDPNLFSKLVKLRVQAVGTSTNEELQTNFDIRKASPTAKQEKIDALQGVFDFFDTVAAEQQAVEKTMEEEIQAAKRAEETAIPPVVRLAKYAADTITKRVLRSLGVDKKVTEKGSFDQLEAQVRKIVNAQMKQELDPKKVSPEDARTLEEMLVDIVQRITLAEEVFNQVQANLQAELSADNELVAGGKESKMSEERRTYIEAMLEKKFDANATKSIDTLLRNTIDFKAESRKHMMQRGATLNSIQQLINQKFPNLREEQVVALAKVVAARYNALVKERAQKQLENITRRIGEKATAMPKSKISQLLELVNLGAFSQEKFYNAIAERYDIPEWDPIVAKEIVARANQISQLPESSDQRITKAIELNAYISQELDKQRKGWEKVGKVLDILASLWKAGVLSGPPTQLVNLGATHINVLFELTSEAKAYAQAAKRAGIKASFGDFFAQAYMAYVEAAGRLGVQEAGNALATGLTRFRSENNLELNPLEKLNKDPDKPWSFNNYAAAWKLVGRVMAAADTYNSVIANEAKARMEARYVMLKQGLTAEQATQKADEIFSKTSAGMQAIQKQVNDEELLGQFGTLAGLAPDSKEYKSQKRKIEAGKSRRFNQLRERYVVDQAGIGQDGITKMREFAQKATFNGQPKGSIGYLMDAVIGNIAGKVPILTPFAAFPRTIANIVNSAIDYTPYGWLRANGVSIGNLSGAIRDSSYKYSKPEKGSVEYYQLRSKALYGSIVMASIIGLAMKDMDKDWDEAFFAVTGRGPSDRNKREQLRATGWTENTVKIGAIRFKHTDFPGLNLLFGALAMVSDAYRYEDLDEATWDNILFTSALSVANSVVDKNLLSGAKTLFDAVSDRGSATDRAKRLLSSYTGAYLNPGIARWLSQTVPISADGKIKVVDSKAQNATLFGWLIGQTPIAVYTGAPMLNRLGDEVRNYPWSATTKRFGFVPDVKPHPVITPLIQEGLVIPGISAASKITVFRNGVAEKRKLQGGEEFYKFSKYNAEYMGRALTVSQAKTLAGLAKVNKELAQKQLNDLATKANDYAKTRLEAEIRAKR